MSSLRSIGASLVCLLAMAASTVVAQQNPAEDLLNRGRVDEAISVLNQQLKSNPENAQALNLLGRSYYALEQWDAAARNAEGAVQREPNNSDFHMWLGRAYGSKADEASGFSAMSLARKTVAEFQKAVQLNAQNTPAKQNLAEFYVEAPGIVGGGKDKARALADQSDATLAHWIRARVALKDKKLEEAEREYKESIAASNNAASAILELAHFYKWTNRPEDVESTVAKAMASSKRRPLDLFLGAELLQGAGRNFPGAIQLLKTYLSGKTVEEGPAFRAHHIMGEMLEKTGNVNGAVAEYQAALAMASSYRPSKEALRRLGK